MWLFCHLTKERFKDPELTGRQPAAVCGFTWHDCIMDHVGTTVITHAMTHEALIVFHTIHSTVTWPVFFTNRECFWTEFLLTLLTTVDRPSFFINADWNVQNSALIQRQLKVQTSFSSTSEKRLCPCEGFQMWNLDGRWEIGTHGFLVQTPWCWPDYHLQLSFQDVLLAT